MSTSDSYHGCTICRAIRYRLEQPQGVFHHQQSFQAYKEAITVWFSCVPSSPISLWFAHVLYREWWYCWSIVLFYMDFRNMPLNVWHPYYISKHTHCCWLTRFRQQWFLMTACVNSWYGKCPRSKFCSRLMNTIPKSWRVINGTQV